ncbi:7916_t:CDS:2, partial [Ambispora leptoticha]
GSDYSALGKDFVLNKYKDRDSDKPRKNPTSSPTKSSDKEIAGSYNSTEFTVHKPIQYLQTTDNKLFLVNEVPFNRYKEGDLLAVDLDRTRFFSPNVERGKIWGNSGIVTKLVAKDPSAPSYKNIPIYKSEEFEGDTLKGDLKLERFTNLRTLIISSHKLTSLNLSECKNLRELDCSNNDLNDLNISGCSKLKKINCIGNNFLEEIDISSCSELTEIGSGFTRDTEDGKLVKGSLITHAKEDSIRNILIIGITGNGKSALANVLTNTNQFKEENSSTSVTKKENALLRIGEGIYSAKEGINQVLFVFKEKFSPNQIMAFNLFKDFISESGITKFTTIIRTNFRDFRGKQKCQEDKDNLLSQSLEISEIINSCNDIIHVDNPPIPVINEEDSEGEREDKQVELNKNEKVREQEIVKKDDSLIKEEELKKEIVETTKEIKLRLEADPLTCKAAIEGKSTLANVLVNIENKFKESSSSASETKKVQFEKFEDKGANYLIIDTIGIGDTKLKQNEVLDIIAEAVYLVRKGISQILFVTDGRFDQSEMSTYDLLRTIIFDKEITQYTTIVRTKFPDFRKAKKCQEDVEVLVKEEGRLKEIIESCQKRVIHVDSPSIIAAVVDEENEEERESENQVLNINRKKRIKSREILLTNLQNICSKKEDYRPEKLAKLINSQEIETKEYENEFDRVSVENSKISQEVEKEKQTSNNQSVIIKSGIRIEEKITISKSDVAISMNIEEIIEKLENKKTRLIKEIQEKKEVIRQKVLKHIFNNYESITEVQGGDNEQITVGKALDNFIDFGIEQLKKKYCGRLEEEINIFDRHNKRLEKEKNSQEKVINRLKKLEEVIKEELGDEYFAQLTLEEYSDEFEDKDHQIENLKRKVEHSEEKIKQFQKERTLFEEEEVKIRYLEVRVQELTNLIKQQKDKIMSSFLRLFPERELLQELINVHLEFTKFKNQGIASLDYNEKCEEYEKKSLSIKRQLRTKLDKKTMNEVWRILIDCEKLVEQELELEVKLSDKSLLIEEQKQNPILQTNDSKEKLKEQEVTHQNQVKLFKRTRSNSIVTEIAKLQEQLEAKQEEINYLKEKSLIPIPENQDESLFSQSINELEEKQVPTPDLMEKLKEQKNELSNLQKSNKKLRKQLSSFEELYFAKKQTIEQKEKELEELKNSFLEKTGNYNKEKLWENFTKLLEFQADIIISNSSPFLIKEKQKMKEKLIVKTLITGGELDNLCQLQTEITQLKLEIQRKLNNINQTFHIDNRTINQQIKNIQGFNIGGSNNTLNEFFEELEESEANVNTGNN